MPTAKEATDAATLVGASVAMAGAVQTVNGVPQLSRKFVARRISEGETGRLKEELKCQACGKGYKHVSSLAKHLWEHTPEWNVTSKLLISKHQQVQLLEAASILVSMNEEDEDLAVAAEKNAAKEEDDDDDDDDDDGDDNDDSEGDGDSSGSRRTGLRRGLVRQTTPSMQAPVLTSDDSMSPEAETAGPPSAARSGRTSSLHAATLPLSVTPPATVPSTPEVPVSSARSISKHTPLHHKAHRRISISNGHGASPSLASSLLGRALHGELHGSPLPDSWARDEEHLAPRRGRRRSTFSRIEDAVDNETRDGLQDPHEKEGSAGIFGDMED